MNRHTIPLGRILGIPIGLDYSWFLIFILITWLLAVSYYPSEFRNWTTSQYWVMGALTAILFFVSVVLHELGHSVIAMHYKIPVRSITLFIFGGVAQIGAEPPGPAAEFWIAIAGPIVSFALGAFCYAIEPLFSAASPLLGLAMYLGFINIALAIFNLIPGFPLDGGRVFRAIVWGLTKNLGRATSIAANLGRFFAFLFIIFGVWQIFLGNFGGGLWIAFIGWFLDSAASAQVQQQVVQTLLAGHKVSEAMHIYQDDAVVAPDTTLQELVDHHILGAGRRSFLVEQGDEVLGLLTLHHIKEVPRSQWPATTVAQAMIPKERMKYVGPDTELWTALASMDRNGVNQLPVMRDGHAEGMLSREDAISYLRTLQELGA
jgi:Zn-dependent protease/CBS domain-containing protein